MFLLLSLLHAGSLNFMGDGKWGVNHLQPFRLFYTKPFSSFRTHKSFTIPAKQHNMHTIYFIGHRGYLNYSEQCGNKTDWNNGYPDAVSPSYFLFFVPKKKGRWAGGAKGSSKRNQWCTDVDATNQVSRIHWKPLAGYKGSCLVSGRWNAIIRSFCHS